MHLPAHIRPRPCRDRREGAELSVPEAARRLRDREAAERPRIAERPPAAENSQRVARGYWCREADDHGEKEQKSAGSCHDPRMAACGGNATESLVYLAFMQPSSEPCAGTP